MHPRVPFLVPLTQPLRAIAMALQGSSGIPSTNVTITRIVVFIAYRRWRHDVGQIMASWVWGEMRST